MHRDYQRMVVEAEQLRQQALKNRTPAMAQFEVAYFVGGLPQLPTRG